MTKVMDETHGTEEGRSPSGSDRDRARQTRCLGEGRRELDFEGKARYRRFAARFSLESVI